MKKDIKKNEIPKIILIEKNEGKSSDSIIGELENQYRVFIVNDVNDAFLISESENIQVVIGVAKFAGELEKEFYSKVKEKYTGALMLHMDDEKGLAAIISPKCGIRLFQSAMRPLTRAYLNGILKKAFQRLKILSGGQDAIQSVKESNKILTNKLKELTLEFQEREQHLNTILETDHECIKILNRKCELIKMNMAGLAICEADNFEQLKGKDVSLFIKELYRKPFRDLIKKTFEGKSGVMEYELVGLKGTHRWVETNCLPMKNDDGSIRSVLSLTRDISIRKNALDTLLLQSEIMNNLEEGVCLIKASDSTFVYTNPAFEKLFGYKLGELFGKRVSIINAQGEISPEQQAQLIIESLETNGKWCGEVRNIKKNRTSILTEARVTKFNHHIFGDVWLTFQSDITEHKKAINNFSKARNLFNYYLDNLNAYAYIKDTDLNYIFINKKCEELFNVNRELSNRKLYNDTDFFEQEFAKRIRKNDNYILTLGEKIETEEYGIARGNENKNNPIDFRYYLALKFPLKDESGNITGLCGFSYDITKLKLSEQALIQSEERLKQASVSAGVMVWETDANGIYTYLSITNEKFLGYDIKEVIGKMYFYDFLVPEQREEIKEQVFALFTRKASFRDFEHINLTKTGEQVYLQSSGIPILDEDGNLLGYRGAGTNITEHKLKEDAIRLSEERLAKAELMSKTGSGEIHLDSMLVYGSKGSMKIYGTERSSLTYSEIKERTLPEYHTIIETAFQGLIEYNEPYEIEFKIRTFDLQEEKCIRSVANYDSSKRVIFITLQDITEQKKTEEIIRSSKERYQSIFDKSPLGIVLVDTLSGVILKGNKKYFEIINRTEEEMIGKSWMEITHPEDLVEDYELLNRIIHGEVSEINMSSRALTKDGTYKWVNVTVAPLLNYENGRKLNLAMIEDISTKRMLEDANREEKEKFFLLFENSMDGIMLTDIFGNVLNANPAICEMLGMTESEICDSGISNIADNNDRRWKQFKIERRNKKRAKGELAFFRKNGERFPVEVTSTVFVTASGEKRISMIIRDLTERNISEQKLLESEYRFRALSENALVGIIISESGKMSFVNNAFAKIFGYEQEELTGGGIQNLVHPLDKEMVREKMKYQLGNNNTPMHFEFRGISKNGMTKWIEVLGVRLQFRNEFANIANILDITERKKSEEKILKSNRIYQVISRINHAMIRSGEQLELMQRVCDISIEVGGFQMAWICKIDNEINGVQPVAWSGVENGYLQEIRNIRLADIPEGRGPTGRAIQEGCYYVCNDIENDEMMSLWKNEAIKRGYRSSISLPIYQYKKVIGAFTLYAGVLNFFDNEEILLLDSVARDISYAMESIETGNKQREVLNTLLTTEKHLRHAQKIAKLGSWIYKKNEGIILSEELCSFLGLNDKNRIWSSQEIVEMVHPNDLIKLQNWSEIIFTIEDGHGIELRMKVPDGGYNWFNVEAEVLREENGIATGLSGTIQDITEIRKTNQALKLSNQLLESSQSIAKLGGWEIDLETLEVFGTAETYRLLDSSVNEFVPTLESGIDYFYPESQLILLQSITEAMNSGKGFDLELEVRTSKQRKINVRVTCDVTLSDGKPIKLAGIFQDISEQKKKELELFKSEEKYRLLFENAAECIIVAQDVNIQLCNKMTEFLTGYSQEELKLLPINQFIHKEDRAPLLDNYTKRINGEPVDSIFSFRIVQKDMNIRWVEMNSILIVWNERNATLNFITDITERKMAEEKLLLSLKETSDYKYAMNESSIVSFTDSEGRITHANDNFCKISQYGKEELIGQNHRLLKSGHHPKKFYKSFWNTITKGKIWKGEIKNKAKDGTFYWVDAVVIPFVDTLGKPIQYMALRVDITERKKAEEELNLLNIQLRKLTAHVQNISENERAAISREIHDVLGQQMTSLKFEIAWLRKKLGDKEVEAQNGINAMNLIVDETIQSIRKISSELRPRILDDLGLNAAVEWFVKSFEKNTGIHCVVNSNLEEILLDKTVSITFYRILQEALTNVARHAKASKVDITLHKNNSFVILEVSDNGKGITESEKGNRNSIGLLGMNERAKMIGGKVEITGLDGVGTKICLQVPV